MEGAGVLQPAHCGDEPPLKVGIAKSAARGDAVAGANEPSLHRLLRDGIPVEFTQPEPSPQPSPTRRRAPLSQR